MQTPFLSKDMLVGFDLGNSSKNLAFDKETLMSRFLFSPYSSVKSGSNGAMAEVVKKRR